jgi:hypothetical protein
MASNPFNFLHGGSRKKEKGRDKFDKVLNQPPDAPSVAGPSTTQARASTSKQSTTGRIMGKLGVPFSRPKTPSKRPTTPTPPTSQPIAATHSTEQQQPKDEATDTPSTGKLTSKRAEAVPEAAAATNKKKEMALELGIHAIDLLTDVSNAAGLVLPNPVGEVLGKVTKVLGTLKVCSTQTDESSHRLIKRLANDGKRGCLERVGQNS